MSTYDLTKLSQKISLHKNFFVFGPNHSPSILKSRIGSAVSNVEDAELVIITERDYTKVIQFLSSLNHNCNVVIWDYTEGLFVSSISKFLDTNASKFQYSKQMLVHGYREKSLYIVCSVVSSLHAMTGPVSIFLVLKGGGPVYDFRYVNATAKNIRDNITHPHEIVCLTDDASGITQVDRVVKFKHNFPKWWGKVELFRSGITSNEHCLFLDLDTVCLQNIDFLCRLNSSVATYGLRDFYHLDTFQTGVLKWSADGSANKIYKDFIKEDFSKYKDRGDHEWIGTKVENKRFIQDECPGAVFSYKKHLPALSKNLLSPKVICFHGDPRPHTVKHDFITSVWKY